MIVTVALSVSPFPSLAVSLQVVVWSGETFRLPVGSSASARTNKPPSVSITPARSAAAGPAPHPLHRSLIEASPLFRNTPPRRAFPAAPLQGKLAERPSDRCLCPCCRRDEHIHDRQSIVGNRL